MPLAENIEKDLATILQEIGLNKSESKVFVYLLEGGQSVRVTNIARRMKMNRTTLYGILRNLSERGLVTSVEDRGILTYRAIDPHLLEDHVERMRQKLSGSIAKIKRVLPALDSARSRGHGVLPSIQFFEGPEGIKQAYEDSLRGSAKQIFGFTGSQAVEYFFKSEDKKWAQKYVDRRSSAGIKFFAITADAPGSRHAQELDAKSLRLTKLLPAGFDFDIEIEIYGSKVLFASYSKEHPLAVLIEDEKIAGTMKTIFRYVDSTLAK